MVERQLYLKDVLEFRKRRDQQRNESIERSAKAGKPSWSADSGFFANLAELTIPVVAVENAAPVWREYKSGRPSPS